ncbi:MAG: alpha-2-macroglobulin [Bacteroidetes bacterium]|nr:MAG: alpha-2-macroglobulin [Bacteroidota bacterium]
MKSHSFPSLFGVFTLFFAISMLVQSCADKPTYVKADEVPAAVVPYVHGFTSGVISFRDPVRVRFTGSAVSAEEVGQDASGILEFSPKVRGRAWWEDQSTLRFDPDPAWEAGQGYVVTVNLDEVYDNLPEGARSFEFDFLVNEHKFMVDIYGLEIPEGENRAFVRGMLITDRGLNSEDVEKAIQAYEGNQPLELAWDHHDDGTHLFLVQNVALRETAGKVELKWDGQPLNMNSRGQAEVELPAISDFRVLSVHLNEKGQRTLTVYFSKPLRSDQNLNGLVALQQAGMDNIYDMQSEIADNKLIVYPPSYLRGQFSVVLFPGIQSSDGKELDRPTTWSVELKAPPPAVRLVGNGAILPGSDKGLLLPFEAVSLQAVEVEIFKIFDNNVMQFLQDATLGDISNSYELRRVGRVISQQMVPLKGLKADADPYEWNRYALDLSKLFTADPNAIYQVRIGFRPSYSLYPCVATEEKERPLRTASVNTEGGEIKSIWDDYYGIEGYYDGFNWSHREDPCYPAYYNRENFAATNVMATNIGLTAKTGEPGQGGQVQVFVAAADLRTAKALSEVELEFYDYQKQLIASAKTNGDGLAEVTLPKKPHFLIAKKEKEVTVMRMNDGDALSMSRFNITGNVVQKGLKGFIYGERGVWRPGDELFLNFILDDPGHSLPENYPVAFELYDARGQLQYSTVVTNNTKNIYPIHVQTDPASPTGNWRAVVKAGGAVFEKTLKVETVKPNRLKLDLKFAGGKEVLGIQDEPVQVDLKVNWLHGAPGANLRTVVEAQLQPVTTAFDNFGGFVFDDPARQLYSEPVVIYDDEVNKEGAASFSARLYNKDNNAPGKLSLRISARAFEKSGDFSIYNSRLEYHPYTAYAGVSVPENKWGEKRLEIGMEKTIRFAAVGSDGKPKGGHKLSVGLYRVDWRWWWERDYNSYSNFNSANHYNAIEKASVTTDSKGLASWNTKVDDWGRYLVRVCDDETGHCSGDFFYAGYPWYDDGSNLLARQAAAMMTFKTSKEKYEVGEDIEVTVPAGESGKVLITLEKGDKVLKSMWKDAKKGENTYRFEATEEMTPNVYVHVSLVQPHGQVQNDLPMRMYGVLSVEVEDPETILEPQIEVASELKPEQEFTVKVSEKNGEPMAYTLAIVDEGLLGLTNFKTPDPHASFYAREALNVHTWDLYDQVLGAFNGKLERVLSLGGDADVNTPLERKNANRFKPVVLNAGPFYLKRGSKEHKFTLPNYIGSVRVMVVAANTSGAYGNAEKTVPVRKPLMVLATLPRTLAPGDQFQLPVTVFAMDKKVKNVTLNLREDSGLCEIVNGGSKSLQFSSTGEQMATFAIQVREGVGIARFRVEASGAGEKAFDEIEIDVKNPNPFISKVYPALIAPGQSWAQDFEPLGIRGTNQAILEASVIPPLNLGERLNFLLRYPHGCIEQTTSSAFPQLYVGKLMKLTKDQQQRIQHNVTAAINKLKNFQNGSGGFGYWPGGNADEWATCYAGHFLMEAQKAGYSVPDNMIKRFIKYQQTMARLWTPTTVAGAGRDYSQRTQAYRLFTLALAGKAEESSMNRLRAYPRLSQMSKWRLAEAYALTGKRKISEELVKAVPVAVSPYTELSYTYGSDLRDAAIVLEAQVLLGDKMAAAENAKAIAERISENTWYSTQTTAYSLMALARYLGEFAPSEEFSISYALGTGARADAGSNEPVLQIEIPVDEGNNRRVNVTNTSETPVYVQLILSGQPSTQMLVEDDARQLRIDVRYTTVNGRELEPYSLPQGTDFIAEVMVTHPGSIVRNFNELALEQLFPAGWEILNARMFQTAEFSDTSTPEYVDVRDDRVYTYFDLRRNERKVFRVRLNAAYVGRYYLPPTTCSAMYDNNIFARRAGNWVRVTEPGKPL